MLTKNVNADDVKLFLADAEKAENENNNVDSILQVSISANEDVYEVIWRENSMCEALRRLMKEDLKAAEAKGEAKKAEDTAKIMIKDREPVAKIQRYTQLTLDDLQELSKKLGIALVM